MAETLVTRHWPLMGRAAELSALRRSLRKPLPSGVLLTGSAGVGKSRLLSELADLAAAEGWVVKWVTGVACGGSVPLGAMVQLVSRLPAGDMDLGRFLIYCREALVQSCRGRRLLVAVDDVPRIDAESVGFLTQLLVLGCGLVAFTARSEEPLPASLASLCKDRLVTELAVAPLSEAAVGELTHFALGGRVSLAAQGRLAELAGGNPLFLRELLAEGVESGRLRVVDGVWELRAPPGISVDLERLIAARLGRLSPEEQEGLEVLAVAASLELVLANRLCGSSTLEVLERRRVTRVVTEGRRRVVRFEQPLFAEAVLANLPPTRGPAICGRLAGAAIAAGTRRREDPLRVARWHLESGHPVGPDILVAAGWRARQAGDHLLTERIAEAAIAAGAGEEAMLLHAEAVGQLGRPADADQALARLQAGAGSEVLRVRAASWRAYLAGMLQSDFGRAVEILETALASLRSPQSRLILRSNLVLLRTFTGAELNRALDEGVRLADDGSAPDEARLQAITLAQLVASWLGRFPLVYELAEKGRRLVESAGPMVREAEARLGQIEGVALTYDGRLPEAVEKLGEGYRRGVQPPLDGYAGVWAIHLALALAISGRLDDALAIGLHAIDLMARGDVPSHLGCTAALTAAIAGQAGNGAALQRALAAIDEHGYFPPPARAWVPLARAWEAWLAGDPDVAADRALMAADRALDNENLLIAAWACHHALEFGRAEQAVDRLQRIAAEGEVIAFSTWARHAVALAGGDATALGAVADEYRARCEYFHAVQAYLQAAELHRARQRDQAAARSIVSAVAVAAATGQLGAWLPPELPGHLTERELEIARNAASGLTSRQIAEQVLISVRTVDNHLASIYTKLGIHNRSELGDLLGFPRQGR